MTARRERAAVFRNDRLGREPEERSRLVDARSHLCVGPGDGDRNRRIRLWGEPWPAMSQYEIMLLLIQAVSWVAGIFLLVHACRTGPLSLRHHPVASGSPPSRINNLRNAMSDQSAGQRLRCVSVLQLTKPIGVSDGSDLFRRSSDRYAQPPSTAFQSSRHVTPKDADVYSLDEWRAARRATVVRDDDDVGEEPRR